MLPQELIPTRLVLAPNRPRVAIRLIHRPSRFRSLWFVYRIALFGIVTLWLRLTMQFTPAQLARSVRVFLLELGTVWVKVGQTLAMRSDLIPAEFGSELASLRDQSYGVPFDLVRQTVESELGGPLDRYFDEFMEAPFAATITFQLHRAKLKREQIWVAVKVLKPYLEETLAADLALLRRVTGWLQFLGVFPKMRWLDLSRQVEEASIRELDLRFEQASLRQLSKNLPRHGIYVPEVFADYSTRRVLTMEFIHAALMADYLEMQRTDPRRLASWLEENNIHPRKIAQRLFHSVWRQILEDNFFHADLHPDNVILLRDNRLAVIDCRSAGQLEAESLAKHRRFIEAIADGEYATAAEYTFLLASRLPRVDLGEVRTAFVRVWRRWENRNYVRELPVAEKSLTLMLHGLNRIMYRYGFEAQWSMARLAWAVVNADTSILQLSAEVNYLHWLRRYFRAANRRRNRIKIRDVTDRATVTLAALVRLPRTLSAMSLAQQEILRRQARVFHGSTSKSGYFLATLYSFFAAGWLALAALISLVILSQVYSSPLEPIVGPQLAGVVNSLPSLGFWPWLGALLIALYLFRRTLLVKRRFLQHDDGPQTEARPAI